ncbi:MAG: twin-arginine translocase TatA/TatE family subunit [Bacteroidales bacterium]|nr:twin-arginine translocase TatA/TatE family subunit [Bacteroidales bacterium]
MKLLFLGTWEIIIIVLVVLLLFGGKKIPELMKGLGKGVKSFKDGVNGVEDTDRDRNGSNGVDEEKNDEKKSE